MNTYIGLEGQESSGTLGVLGPVVDHDIYRLVERGVDRSRVGDCRVPGRPPPPRSLSPLKSLGRPGSAWPAVPGRAPR